MEINNSKDIQEALLSQGIKLDPIKKNKANLSLEQLSQETIKARFRRNMETMFHNSIFNGNIS